MDSIHDDVVLVRLAQGGSVEAFAELTGRHSLMVYRVSLRMVGNDCDAQDLAQECMLAAWLGLSTFRAEAQYSTWLYRIVTRRALNHLTRVRPFAPLAEYELVVSTAAGPSDCAERNETVAAVTSAVMRLPAAQRAVVVLHHFEGLSYQQTAAATQTTVSAVRSHLFRARRTLTLTLADAAVAAA